MRGAFGSSDFASAEELRAAGMLADDGLLLGALAEGSSPKGGPQALRYAGDHHHLVVAGTGGGKYVSSLGLMLFDFLFHKTGSCVVIDPKGEALHKIGKLALRPFGTYQQDKDYEVMWLDPWDLSQTGRTWSLNALSSIRATNPSYFDDARALADAIVVPSNRDNDHWDTSARGFLTGILLYVGLHPAERARRDLVRVLDILALPWEPPDGGAESLVDVLFRMRSMEEDDTFTVRRIAEEYLGKPEKERESIFSCARRDTFWINSAQIQKTLRSGPTEIDPAQVARGRCMVFVVLPVQRIDAYRSWLRLVITTFANAFRDDASARGGGKVWGYEERRHIFVDEFPRLGKLENVAADVAVARGFGLQYHLYCQSFGQLKGHYGEAWEDLFGNSLVQAFAVRDNFTARYLSESAGRKTVHTEQESVSRDARWQRSTSQSFGQTSRDVLMPDEIGRLGDLQLIIARGIKPIVETLLPVFRFAKYEAAQALSLPEVVGAMERAPRDDVERKRFMWWV